MNILILNQYALPAGSPGITRHGDLGAALVRRGHSVTIIASSFDYLTRKFSRTNTERNVCLEDYSGVKFSWLKTTSYSNNGLKRILSMLEYSLKSTWQGLSSSQEKPDIIYASSPQLLAGLAGYFLSRYFGVPLIFEVRDLWPSSLADLGAISQSSLTYKLLESIEKFLYKNATCIIGVPPLAYQRIEEVGVSPEKVVHIPNGISVEEALSVSEEIPDSLATIFSSESSRKIIMYTGAHGLANNLGNVIESIEHLKLFSPDVYDNIAVIFIGGGQQRDELIQLGKNKKLNHIYFHPPIDKHHLKVALKKADLLLFHLADAKVFQYGISPNKLYDYFEAAKPILFSCTDTDNLIERIGAGITFYPDRPESLAKAITKLSTLPSSSCQDMGERGRDYVLANHDWSQLAQQVESIMLNVA